MTHAEYMYVAQCDLPRLGKKFGIDVAPKSPHYLVLWRRDIRTFDYTVFKDDYIDFSRELGLWLTNQSDTSDCWLSTGLSLTPGRSGSDIWFQFSVHKKAE